MSARLLLTLGLLIFLAGGAVLAFMPGAASTSIGTSLGILGAALMALGMFKRNDEPTPR